MVIILVKKEQKSTYLQDTDLVIDKIDYTYLVENSSLYKPVR